MLCINKRLYRPDRPEWSNRSNRSDRPERSNRPEWSDRPNRSDWSEWSNRPERSDRPQRCNRTFRIRAAGQLPGGVFHAIPDRDNRHSSDL